MPGGGGSEEFCCEVAMGAKELPPSNTPFPNPLPQMLLLEFDVVGQGENASLLTPGDRPSGTGCDLRSPGDEYDADVGAL
jgi:hypothetical protein